MPLRSHPTPPAPEVRSSGITGCRSRGPPCRAVQWIARDANQGGFRIPRRHWREPCIGVIVWNKEEKSPHLVARRSMLSIEPDGRPMIGPCPLVRGRRRREVGRPQRVIRQLLKSRFRRKHNRRRGPSDHHQRHDDHVDGTASVDECCGCQRWCPFWRLPPLHRYRPPPGLMNGAAHWFPGPAGPLVRHGRPGAQ